MGGHRTDFDELKAFERLCLELVAAAAMPSGQGSRSWRATTGPRSSTRRPATLFANTVQTGGFFRQLPFIAKLLILLGERAGARTPDPVICISHVSPSRI
jgi:hypothetical protein